MFRFSLTAFLLAVAVASMILAGLAFPNLLWMQVIATVTLSMLLAASVGALAWQLSGRWFWIGFSVVGWSYLAIAFYGDDSGRQILLTHTAVRELDELLKTSSPFLSPTYQNGRTLHVGNDLVYTTAGGFSIARDKFSLEEAEKQGLLRSEYTWNTIPKAEYFIDIGHYGWSLLLGCIGGGLSLTLHRRSAAVRLRADKS